MSISNDEKRAFVDSGVIRLPGMISAPVVEKARRMVYQRLEKSGFWDNGYWVDSPDQAAARKRLKKALHGCSRSATFADLLTTGSHRLENDAGVLGSKEVKRRLKRHDYFRDLMNRNYPNRDRFIDEGRQLDDVTLKVIELTGSPGDTYFTDLRLLHTLGPNASDRPRIMVTQRFPRASTTARVH